MPRLPDSARGPSIALNSFWRQMVQDGGLLEKTLSAAEVLLGQLYYDMLMGVQGTSLVDAPIFGKRYVMILAWSRGQRLERVEDGQTVYYYALPDEVVDVPRLYNLAVRPSFVMETGIDYQAVTLEGRRWLRTSVDLFSLNTVKLRTTNTEPSVRIDGVDGLVESGLADVDLPDPDADPAGYVAAYNARHLQRRTFTTSGRLRLVRGATFDGPDTRRVRAPEGVFVPGDVGRKLQVFPGPVDHTITEVLSERVVRVATPVAPATDPFDVALRTDTVFTADDVGATLRIEHPDGSAFDGDYRILAVNSALEVELDRALPFGVGDPPDATNLRWYVYTARYGQEAVMYAQDVLWDHRDLARRYGRVLGRERDSSRTYRDYLRAAQVFFWGGPTVAGMTALMTLAAGFPVTATSQERLVSVTTGEVDIITTDRGVYAQVGGYLREDIADRANWGTLLLHAFEPFTDAFYVNDDQRDPTWLYGQTLPQDMLPAVDAGQRRVTPLNRPMMVNGEWGIGDPGAYVGSDSDGRSVESYVFRGADAIWYDDGSTYGALAFYDTPVHFRWSGRQAFLESKLHRLKTADPSLSKATLDTDLSETLLELTFVAVGVGDILTVTAGDPPRGWRDIGRWVDFGGTPFRVVDVPAPNQIQVVDSAGSPPALGGSATCLWAVRYAIIERPPMITNLGVMAAHLASPNIFGVEYNATDFLEVLPQLLRDTLEFIDVGRPAHARRLTNPLYSLDDLGVFLDDAEAELAFPVHFLMAPRATLYVGDPWDVGEYHWSPRQDVRFSERLVPADMAGAADAPAPGGVWRAGALDMRDATQMTLRLSTTPAGGGSYSGRVLVWNSDDPSDVGGSWVPTGDVFTLTEAAPTATFAVSGVIASLELTAVTDSVMAVTVGARYDSLQEVRSPAHLPSGVCQSTAGLDVLELAPFLTWPVDVGRRIVLTYPAVPFSGLAQQVDVVRVVSLPSTTQVGVVDESTGAVYAAPRTASDVAWRFGAHRGWGQTPRNLGDPPRLATWPGARTTRLGLNAALPIEVTIAAK